MCTNLSYPTALALIMFRLDFGWGEGATIVDIFLERYDKFSLVSIIEYCRVVQPCKIKILKNKRVNSLTSMDRPIRPIFWGLHKSVIFFPILVHAVSQNYKKLADLFSYNHDILHLHTACRINDLSTRGPF
jgi:hypothetical protein